MEMKQEGELIQHKVEQECVMMNKYGDGVAWYRGSMIGKGSFGSVFLGNLKKPKSKFSCFPSIMAVKSAEVSVSWSIQKEKEVLSNLGRCNNVIRCFGEETTIGLNGEMVYNLLLEFGSGGTLGDLIKQSGGKGLPESDVRQYTRAMLLGIYHIHESGYVHCDLKPDNILLVRNTKSGGASEFRVKIGDLGLAKRSKQIKRKLEPYWRGTPMYLSPETVIDSVQGCPADIWALGCMVLEMLTGQPPWDRSQNSDADQLLSRIGKGRALPKIPNEISTEARKFLKACLVRKPMNRLTADKLLNQPFVKGLANDNEEEEEDEEIDEVSNVNMNSSLLVLSDAGCSHFSDDCSSLSGEYAPYFSEEDIGSGEVTGFAKKRKLEVQESGDIASSSITSEFNHVIKSTLQAPSNARQQFPIAFPVPAGV